MKSPYAEQCKVDELDSALGDHRQKSCKSFFLLINLILPLNE